MSKDKRPFEVRFYVTEAERKKLVDAAIKQSSKEGRIQTVHAFVKGLTLKNL